jgi:hypothetical protein
MTKATETAKPETTDTAALFAATPYEEDLDPSDCATGTSTSSTKFFAIAQNQGKNRDKIQHAGQFYSKNDDGVFEFFENLDVIILESGFRSTRFDDDKVACRSYDGKTGSCGKKCREECQYYFFAENAIAKDQKCKNSILLLCVPAADWATEPFFLQCSPSAIKDWKKFAFEMQRRFKRPVFSAITRLTTTLREEKQGMAYCPVFTPVKALTAAETAKLREIRQAEVYRYKAPEEGTDPATSFEEPAAGTSASFQDGGMLHGDEDDPFVNE